MLRYDKDSTFTFFDLETQNLLLKVTPKTAGDSANLPWQCALATQKGGKIIKKRDIFIFWGDKWQPSAEAARITRYNHSVVRQRGIKPKDAFEEIYETLSAADYLVGHNLLGFDFHLIKDWCDVKGRDWRPLHEKILDTLALSRAVRAEIPFKKGDNLLEFQYKMLNYRKKGIRTSLGKMCEFYDLDYDKDLAHDALYDISKNVEVWNKLKFDLEL